MNTLVLEGGGMRAGFVAGVLMAWMDNRIVDFDSAIAVSGSVPTLGYFAAGQRKEMEFVWRNELHTPELIHYKYLPHAALTGAVKRPVLDVDYLVDKIIGGKYPVDMAGLNLGRTRPYFAAAELPSGRLAIFSPKGKDLSKIYKACLWVPAACPDSAVFGEGEYLDGGVANPLPARWIFRHGGGRRIVAVLSKPPRSGLYQPTTLQRMLFRRYFKENEWLVRKLREAYQTYHEELDFLERLANEKPPRAMLVYPEERPPVRFISRDGRKINRTIDLGYEKGMALSDQVRAFLHGKKFVVRTTQAFDTPIPSQPGYAS